MNDSSKKHRRIRSSTDWEYKKIMQIGDPGQKSNFDIKSSSFVGTSELTKKLLENSQKIKQNKEIIIDDLSAVIEDTTPILPRTVLSQKGFIGFSPFFNLHNQKKTENVDKILEKPQYMLTLNQIDEENDERRNSLSLLSMSMAKIYGENERNGFHSQTSSTSTNPQKSQPNHKLSLMSRYLNLPSSSAIKGDNIKNSSDGVTPVYEKKIIHEKTNTWSNFDLKKLESQNAFLKSKENHHCLATDGYKARQRRYHSEITGGVFQQVDITIKSNISGNNDEKTNCKLLQRVSELEKSLAAMQNKFSKIDSENNSLNFKIEILSKQNENLHNIIKKNDSKIQVLSESNTKFEKYLKKIYDVLGLHEKITLSGEIENLQTESSNLIESPRSVIDSGHVGTSHVQIKEKEKKKKIIQSTSTITNKSRLSSQGYISKKDSQASKSLKKNSAKPKYFA